MTKAVLAILWWAGMITLFVVVPMVAARRRGVR